MAIWHGLLIVYAFVGCAVWLWTLYATLRIARAVPVLADCDPPEPRPWPHLSIVIPACNEAQGIEAAVRTLLAQDYPDLQIVLVDDRSTDGTGAIIDRLAECDSRVRILHIDRLPDGWLGKVHALAQGVERAHGDWLLVTDADVHFAPGALRRAVAYAEHRHIDHLAAMPDLWSSSFWLDLILASFLRSFPIGIRAWAVEDPASDAYIGVGAFNLVRRAALERTPGFEWLRLEVADDMGLGLMLKRSGARQAAVNARGLLGLHWYTSLTDMASGVEKGYSSLGQCSPLRMIDIAAVAVVQEWAPLVALLPYGPRWLFIPSLIMLAAALASSVIVTRNCRRPILPGLLFPLSVFFAVPLILRAAWLGWRRGGVMWRGTLYPSAMLNEGRRVYLPRPPRAKRMQAREGS